MNDLIKYMYLEMLRGPDQFSVGIIKALMTIVCKNADINFTQNIEVNIKKSSQIPNIIGKI